MTEPRDSIPLFPLHTVLFPGGPVSLRIFETRYLDMVSRCLREDMGFGVVLIRAGRETGPASVQRMGTVARIRDWDRLEDGLLGITALGEHRFLIESVRQEKDGLNMADITPVPEAADIRLPGHYRHLARMLEEVLPRLPKAWQLVTPKLDDAVWVGYRLAELLPVNMIDKQHLLEMEDPLERLAEISRYFEAADPAGQDDG